MAIRYAAACSSLLCILVSACASAPPAPAPKQLTREETLRKLQLRDDQYIAHEVAKAAEAGRDSEAIYERLHLRSCLNFAAWVDDATQRSATIQQCRVDWPQRPQPPVVSSTCTNYDNEVRCSSQ